MSEARPKLLTSLAILHWLLAGVFFAGLIAIVVTLGKEAGNKGVSLGPITCGVFALIFTLLGLGVWKQRKWGQWSAIGILSFLVAVIGYALYEDGEFDPDVLGVLLVFGGLLVLHLLPWTWRGFRASKLESTASSI